MREVNKNKREVSQKALVFNIQRYCVHDGPGIRTIVFLKGCPLHCPWCANPEGISQQQELYYNSNLCKKCGRCQEACHSGAIAFCGDDEVQIQRDMCTLCGKCVEVCQTGALKIFGSYMSVQEILEVVCKDEVFYKRSGGGLTVSGGEPWSWPAFLRLLLKTAKKEYQLHTAVETTCYTSEKALCSVIEFVDYIISDIKLIDSRRHKDTLGVSNELILRNIRLVVDKYLDGRRMLLRMPVIPSINDDKDNIYGISQFIRDLKKPLSLELLPYHEFGRTKYRGLGLRYPLEGQKIEVPTKEYMAKIEELFLKEGVEIVHT